MQRQDGILSAL